MTMNATSGLRAATMGAITPPSLWPSSPILRGFTSARALRYARPASASVAKSAVVEVAMLPPDLPTPRSSARNTTIPLRVR